MSKTNENSVNESSSTQGNTSSTDAPEQKIYSFTPEQITALINGAVAASRQDTLQAHPQNAATSRNERKADRPSIGLDSSESRWSYFLSEWRLYKSYTKLETSSPLELRQCCSEDLKMALFEFLGRSIDDLSEQRLLEEIKQLAVQGKNTKQ